MRAGGVAALGFGVWGLGLGFGVWGLGFKVWSSREPNTALVQDSIPLESTTKSLTVLRKLRHIF